jgi:hypothetical protein
MGFGCYYAVREPAVHATDMAGSMAGGTRVATTDATLALAIGILSVPHSQPLF